MNSTDYEYSGLMASTWDLWRGDTSNWDDRRLFFDLARDFGQPVLDVGCGTGRIVLDFASQGIAIDGVDNSPEMLAICRDKAGRLGLDLALYQQTMEALDLPRVYRTVLVPSSSFQLVLDRAAAAEAMRRFFRHVEPGGALVMPFYLDWKPGDPLDSGWSVLWERVRPEDGATVRRHARVRYDPVEQFEHTEDRYEVVVNGEVIASEHHARSPATRWYSQAQAAQLYHDAGFAGVEILRGFERAPASDSDALFTVIGRRP